LKITKAAARLAAAAIEAWNAKAVSTAFAAANTQAKAPTANSGPKTASPKVIVFAV
jgi:hypothetical protein